MSRALRRGSRWAYWIQASRPLALVNTLIPLVFGYALGIRTGAVYARTTVAVLVGFALLTQFYIVFLNDVADLRADRRHPGPSIFGGGSRVLPDNKLKPRTLLRAGFAAIAALILAAGVYAWLADLPALPFLFAAGVVLLWMYSFSPFRLNYRGGGEIVQAAGCGILLPLIGWYLATGTLSGLPLLPSLVFLLLSGSAAVATTLPDAEADKLAGKRTLAVRYGVATTAAIAIALALAAFLVLRSSTFPVSGPGTFALRGVLLLLLGATLLLHRVQDRLSFRFAVTALLLLLPAVQTVVLLLDL